MLRPTAHPSLPNLSLCSPHLQLRLLLLLLLVLLLLQVSLSVPACSELLGGEPRLLGVLEGLWATISNGLALALQVKMSYEGGRRGGRVARVRGEQSMVCVGTVLHTSGCVL